MMPREDWELYVVATDGNGERRLTHEIQHDLLPRWLDSSTVLAVMGEARHRRSYRYDAATGARLRLFHNNTVRTVAPEYEWAVAPGGRFVAVVAERDGDTVSPERGVYVMDLRTPVPVADLVTRVRAQRESERALRAMAADRFAPIASTVRAVTQAVSRDWIYRYAADLYAFGSKHVSQPGNAKAISYLDSAYRSFGYEPVLQWFQPGNNPRSANVIATLRGTVSPEVVYVVASHFDSRAQGPGADDNSSGTTMLLETARVLARHPLPATVMFVSFTGEESGLLGSREFVRQIRDSINLVAAMNNDMMGWSNDQRLDNTIRYSNPGIRDVQHAAALEFSRLITYDALYYKSTDAAAFYEAYGDIVGGFGSYPILGNPHYHQSHDVLETINFDLMTENTRANVATTMLLASVPSRVSGVEAVRGGSGVTVSWKPNPELDIRDYVVRYRDSSGSERTVRSTTPRATLPALPAGTEIQVRAVNRRGLEGWDWGRAIVK
jgi:aminopeptidase YwaD